MIFSIQSGQTYNDPLFIDFQKNMAALSNFENLELKFPDKVKWMDTEENKIFKNNWAWVLAQGKDGIDLRPMRFGQMNKADNLPFINSTYESTQLDRPCVIEASAVTFLKQNQGLISFEQKQLNNRYLRGSYSNWRQGDIIIQSFSIDSSTTMGAQESINFIKAHLSR